MQNHRKQQYISLSLLAVLDLLATLHFVLHLSSRALSSGQCVLNRSDIKLLSPILAPEKVVCVGMNYRDHCLEQNAPIPSEPIIFNKFPNVITGPYDDIILPSESQVKRFSENSLPTDLLK